MAELADAYGSGPYECKFMQVQVLLPAPKEKPSIQAENGLNAGFFTSLRAIFSTSKTLKIASKTAEFHLIQHEMQHESPCATHRASVFFFAEKSAVCKS